MFGEIFDSASNQSALWAVVLGALLATMGGFAATQLERIVEHNRRERNAALFFGELLTTLQIILKFAKDAHGRGDPYGPITMRMLQSARKEIDIYDLNRETLFDLRRADLRARIQTFVIRITMPLEGIFESAVEINALRAQIKSPLNSESYTLEESKVRFAELLEQREGGFVWIMENADKLTEIVRDLEPFAKHTFRDAEEVVRTS